MKKLRVMTEPLKKLFNFETKTVEQMRQDFTAMNQTIELIPGTTVEKVMIASYLPAEWIRAANIPKEKDQVILYFHGGGFVFENCNAFRNSAALISEAAGVQVLLVEYRLAPEHKYPAANDDCLAAYRWLLDNGFSNENIVIGGESCGGTLALMTLLSLRDAGDPPPAAALILYWFDPIKFDGESYTSRAELDPLYNLKSFQIPSSYYFDSPAVKLPISPLSQNLAGLPSMLILVGDHEVILSDSIRLAECAKKAGVDVTLKIWDNMWHGFHYLASIQDLVTTVPEGRQGVDNIGKFVQRHLG